MASPVSSESAMLARLRGMATDEAARGLADDVALLGPHVLTHDTIVEGVHYRADDPPESVGWKLVAVNLSDLAAKGAKPLGALLSLALRRDPAWEEAFVSGLDEACRHYGLELLGGDTVSLPDNAPRVLGLTAIGEAGKTVPSRAGARVGDELWVAGTLGDAAAGLALLDADPEATGPLVEAYRRPRPLLEAGAMLAPLATAMMDVSDGLLLDAQRLALASGCGFSIDLSALPLSNAFRTTRGEDRTARLFAATGGDDYALLVGLAPGSTALTLPQGSSATFTRVGELTKNGVFQLADDLGPVPLPERLGYEHH